MKRITIVLAMMVACVAMSFANVGDPVAKVFAQIEKADIQLTTQQIDKINEIANETVLSINRSSKTKGQKGSRKAFKKEQRRSFKSQIYNEVFTVDQRDKWDTFKGR